jgi:uncharacterized damage-inducible protein DinB
MVAAADALLAEFDAEVPATRRVLERLPADRFEWQPHPRSLSAGQLARHVASIPGNVVRLAQMDGFDVATAPGTYPAAESRDTLLASFEDSVTSLRALLARLDDPSATATWRLTFNGREIAAWSRLTLIRTMGLNHWYHHRGELVVYLRLLGAAVPVVYGRSADENPFATTVA